MKKMLQRIFRRFRKEPDFNEFTYLEYVQYLRKIGDKAALKAIEELQGVPKLLALFERATAQRSLTLAEIEQMKMKEIRFRFTLILESQLQTIQALEKITGDLSKSSRYTRNILDEPGWDGVIVNKQPLGVK